MAILATAVWRVRISGSNNNGGGYDPGIGGAATDYSQQNAAQATGTNGATTGAGVTTFTDATAGAFTSAMVGNCIQIRSGTNFQTGFYFVTAFTNANSVVLDRTPTSGGAGSAGVWSLGGGWADFWTNTTSSGPPVPGNTIYILGSGIPNPSSYTYDYIAASGGGATAGDTTNGRIVYAADPATPSYKAPPDTTGGMPVIKKGNFALLGANYLAVIQLYVVADGAGGGHAIYEANVGLVYACVYDQFSSGGAGALSGGANTLVMGCEGFSSGTIPGGGGSVCGGNNIHNGVIVHDCSGGFQCQRNATFVNCIAAKTSGIGIQVQDVDLVSTEFGFVFNNTIDGNTSDGIQVVDTYSVGQFAIWNNIISNQTGVGKFGLNVAAGTTATNNRVKWFCDYNVYYNNTSNYNAISAGAHDTALGVSPYVASGTENYNLA